MPQKESSESVVSRVLAGAAAGERPSAVRVLLATVLPPTIVLILKLSVGGASGWWSLFYPAVFACAWLGGLEAGVAATLLSSALMWWYFVPPQHVIVKPAGPSYAFALVFVVMGVAISAVIRGLRRSTGVLARNQRFLQGILDYSPDAIIIKNLDSRYIVVNKAFEVLTGVRRESALEHTDLDLFPTVVADRFRSNDKTVRETRAPLFSEEKIAEADPRVFLVGKFPLLDQRGAVFAIGAIWTDISQHKRDEAALRQSMDDLRTAQHVAHVGSWRWDFRTNQSTWSEELYEIFGIDRHQSAIPLVNPGLKLLTPDSVGRLRAAIEKLRIDGQPYELDLEFTRPDGSPRWCAARGEAVRDETGRIVGINGTAADVTHIKELERLRDEWTSVIAHDLRQPIGVITMASDFLPELHSEGFGERERAMLQHIQSAAHTLKRMVDDLLDMSLVEAHRLKLERRSVEARTLVHEIVDRLSPITGGRVKYCETGTPAKVYVDPMRIEQVLGNLFSNAVKYGDPNGEIEVRVDRAADHVEIAVTNRGKGIDGDELPRLFDRFMRAKRTTRSGAPGLGLGLYIAKGVIEAHGGRIWAESIPDKRTTFHIALPMTEARAQAA